MKMRDYIKKEKQVDGSINLSKAADVTIGFVSSHKKLLSRAFFALGLLLVSALFISRYSGIADANDLGDIKFADMPIALSSVNKSVISIPKGMVKANPFVPYRDITESGVINDVPTYNIVAPPEVINENSDAARVMDTLVSGILYDKFSPSAIINIEGSDYLVKKGDVVNNYKVINITQDSVTVQLGSNTYKAGIGEILTEGTVNHNDVANLKNKFGGENNGLQ